uniref:Glycoside hydrolase 35 catalytic domain-containing protein n=1 Tax=Acrobeloides nanus TaxID=290746 RepID=A0A914CHI3_9BILA
MVIRFVLFLFLISVLPQDTHGGTFTVDYPNQQFLKDGKPFQYVAGEIHYFRIHPDQWEDRLQRVRAAGLNAIQVYTPWNLHEPVEGQ